MVPQIEYPGESGAGKLGFIPFAGVVLGSDQVVDSPFNRLTVCFPGSHESEEFDFDLPDQNPDMGMVLWKGIKGEYAPTPHEIKELRKKKLYPPLP